MSRDSVSMMYSQGRVEEHIMRELASHTVPDTTVRIIVGTNDEGLYSVEYRINETIDIDKFMMFESEAEARAYANRLWIETVNARNAQAQSRTVTEGFWTLNGSIYKVQENQAGTRMYAKVLTEAGWVYAPGAMRELGTPGAHRLTEDEAAQYGKLYGTCCICGLKLTSEKSIERGIGPVCASKQGW